MEPTWKLWCPRCRDGWATLYRGSALPFWACQQCDGVWKGPEIGPEPDTDLSTHLAAVMLSTATNTEPDAPDGGG